jgi:hypothetical protein
MVMLPKKLTLLLLLFLLLLPGELRLTNLEGVQAFQRPARSPHSGPATGSHAP